LGVLADECVCAHLAMSVMLFAYQEDRVQDLGFKAYS